MIRLRGHFDGTQIVLDEPVPDSVRPDTAVEVAVPDERDLAFREWHAFSQEFWLRPLPPDFQPTGRIWKREDLHERRGRDLS
jgi:hypothetical protein